MADDEVQVRSFIEAAGRSLAEMTMALSEVELEVKVMFEQPESGRMTLRPLSAGAARAGGIKPEAVSTVRVRYLAVGPESEG